MACGEKQRYVKGRGLWDEIGDLNEGTEECQVDGDGERRIGLKLPCMGSQGIHGSTLQEAVPHLRLAENCRIGGSQTGPGRTRIRRAVEGDNGAGLAADKGGGADRGGPGRSGDFCRRPERPTTSGWRGRQAQVSMRSNAAVHRKLPRLEALPW